MAHIEHLGERISEKVLHSQAQPGQRGYIQGTHQRAGMAVGKNSFGVKTLVGNWYEEQCDVRHHPGRPLLITDQEKLWKSEQMRTISKPKWDVQLRNDEHILKADQTTHLELSDRKNNPIFPGHKAPASAKFTQGPEKAWETEQRSSFTQPKGRKFIFRKFVSGLGRQADDKPWNDRLEEIRTTWTKSTPLTLQRINETENRRAFQDWSSSIRAQQQEGKFTTRTQTAK